jgi:drug/metabolite transporter (DMT)-like permease
LLLFREAIPPATLAGGGIILAAIALAAHAQLAEQRSRIVGPAAVT